MATDPVGPNKLRKKSKCLLRAIYLYNVPLHRHLWIVSIIVWFTQRCCFHSIIVLLPLFYWLVKCERIIQKTTVFFNPSGIFFSNETFILQRTKANSLVNCCDSGFLRRIPYYICLFSLSKLYLYNFLSFCTYAFEGHF